MPTYRLDLAYDGAPFHGYARQRAVRTVQGDLEAALFRLTGEIETNVAGRTDAGVHAAGQVVSFTVDAPIDTERVLRSLNRQLGPAIAVRRLALVDDGFHARFSATARQYEYRVLSDPVHDPFLAPTSWHVAEDLDVAAMNRAATAFVGERDFASLCRRADGASTVRAVSWASWGSDGGLLRYSVAASSFCHQMVRSMVAICVDVGRGRVGAEDVEQILDARDRNAARGAAPPHGLTLVAVAYPGEELEPPRWSVTP